MGRIKIGIIFFIYIYDMTHLKIFENFNTTPTLEDEMLKGYLEAAIWLAEFNEDGDGDYYIDDVSDYSIKSSKKDIKQFIERCILHGYIEDLTNKMSGSSIGHDFWLTRNGHGAGFWDRDLGDLGDNLTTICEDFGTRNCFVEDDNKILIE
jgi:hypothetical protein